MTSVTPSYAPQNPDEQLKVGMRMIELAFEEKARVLEQEVRGLREYSQERQSQLTLMERRAGELEGQLREAEQRQRDLAAENASLNAEKSQLSHELKNAQREKMHQSMQRRRAFFITPQASRREISAFKSARSSTLERTRTDIGRV